MFRGVKTINMDAKHRIAIPVAFRDALLQQSAGRLVANIDLNQPKCLAIYPANVWEEIEEKIQTELRNAGKEARILRLLLSNATDIEMDANGRMVLPVHLRQHCQLEKTVVLAGLGKKFELWREDEWQLEQAAGFEQIQDAELVSNIVGMIGYI